MFAFAAGKATEVNVVGGGLVCGFNRHNNEFLLANERL
jgi:hypothetical protein